METKFPSAEAYSNEPIRHAPLEVVGVAAEQRAVTADYCNMVLSRVNVSCLRLAVFHISGQKDVECAATRIAFPTLSNSWPLTTDVADDWKQTTWTGS
jgi:hypothetical protein